MGKRELKAISTLAFGMIVPGPFAYAAPVLSGVDPAIKTQILGSASPEQLCEIETLEKDFGLVFKSGVSPTLLDERESARTPHPNSPCNTPALSAQALKNPAARLRALQSAGALDIGVTNAADFLASLSDISSSFTATCAFKQRVEALATKSADVLAENFSEPLKFTPVCEAPGGWDTYVKRVAGTPACVQATTSAAWFVECFRIGKCTGDCAVGATAAELNLLYDVYDENGNGKLEGAEREAFDDAIYPGEAVAGNFTTSKIAGVQSTLSGTQGASVEKPYRSPRALAKQGSAAFSGVLMTMSAKGSYRSKYQSGEFSTPNGEANLAQNGMVLTVSPAAAKVLQNYTMVDDERANGADFDALSSQFEKDFAEIRALVRKLPYSEVKNGYATGNLAYEQITNYKNYDGIMNGTVLLQGFNAGDTRVDALGKLVAKLQAPTLNEVEVFVHPLGRVKLAQVALYMIHHHPDANATFNVHPSGMNVEQPCRYLNARVDRCLKRTRAEREAQDRRLAERRGVTWKPRCQRTSVDLVR